MGNYINLLFGDGLTMLLYTLLVIFSALFAWRAQPSKYYGSSNINKGWFILSFLLLCTFLAFADNGTDTEWYTTFFMNRRTFAECEYGPVELGFQYYNAFMHVFTDEPIIFVIISRTIMMVFVYWAFYLLRDKSVLWLAVLGFACIIYFQMFSALRNGLAYSIGFLVYALCVRNKNVFAIALAIIGISLHRSMAMFTFAIILYFLVTKVAPRLFKRIAIPVLIAVIAVVYFYGISIFQYVLMSDDALMGKYGGYIEGEETQGFMILFTYLPLAYVFLDFKYAKRIDSNIYYLNSYLSIIGFAFALLAYQVGQLTRVAPFFALPFLFYIGYYVQNALHDKNKHYLDVKFFVSLLTLYWFYKFTMFVSGLYFSNSLNNYHFFTFS